MNHLGNANKMVGEDVSNEQMTANATPNEELRRQILSHVVPKNEREWWAARAIERLEFELNAANSEIEEKRKDVVWLATEKAKLENYVMLLEEAGDAMAEWLEDMRNLGADACLSHAWREAKEAKL